MVNLHSPFGFTAEKFYCLRRRRRREKGKIKSAHGIVLIWERGGGGYNLINLSFSLPDFFSSVTTTAADAEFLPVCMQQQGTEKKTLVGVTTTQDHTIPFPT